MGKHAAITIISKNYFSFAKTLAESYKKHHPENDFLIVLVDRAAGLVPDRLECGAEVIELTGLQIPDLAGFIYRYTIMELNTAVKPFALSDLFRRRGYETLLYIDPDIWVFRPLSAVYEALTEASVVLIPHIRRPYYDDAHPSDLSILQSGTYNLGFVGLRAGDSATRLLDWWMTKLYRDCIVDIPNGLFVDQKWMDMVPGFFPDHRIIDHPGYNVAYWNLHERRLSADGDDWRVDGEPLVFFHFSGYSPIVPHSLSKHQNRHQLDTLPDLKKLTDAYGEQLFANGYDYSSNWKYAFETLDNGVRLPLPIVRDVMQWASRQRLDTPDPLQEPDAFCRFLMKRGILPQHPKSVLLYHFLLRRRSDVAAAFPGAVHDSDDRGFREWLSNSGRTEELLADLMPFEYQDGIDDYVADLFRRLRVADRQDVFRHFKAMWADDAVFDEFVAWCGSHGVRELGFVPGHAERLAAAKGDIARLLHIYFLRGDLQTAFPVLWEPPQRQALLEWFRAHRAEFGLLPESVSLFGEFATHRREMIEKMRFLYSHFGRQHKLAPSIYAIDEVRHVNHIVLENAKIRDWLADEAQVSPADHYVARYGRDMKGTEDFRRCTVPGLPAKKNYAFVSALRDAVEQPVARPVVNMGGFLNAPSGMGESARSMLSTLRQSAVDVHPMTLPHPRSRGEQLPTSPVVFGWPSSRADLSITVANADSRSMLESFLPNAYWAPRNVGYWVWETEELPAIDYLGDLRFDQIWTPSKYSAESIRHTVPLPVRVLPHTLDFAGIGGASGDREAFGLPSDGLLLGFIFDPESVLERKNVAGLIQAFQDAFRPDDRCFLVLKVNGRGFKSFDYETLKARAAGSRVLFVESTYSRSQTYDFMKSLDAYVSLHRSEGFGLTCAESMALGLPVVASGYSGNLEFMDDDNSLLVPTRVVETDRRYGAYPAGTRWGEPDHDAAVQRLRDLLDPELRADIGARAARSVRESLSERRLGKLANAYVRELLDNTVVVARDQA